MTKVTIEDISRHTGLSRGTVSRALNDRPDISEATKQRVLEACRTLNYVPSYAARSLATGRTFAVTVLVPENRTSFINTLLRGVLARAAQAQYLVSLIEVGKDTEVARERLRVLSGERIDGLIVAAALDADTISRVRETLGDRPIAATGAVPGIAADVFLPDFTEAGRIVASHLAPIGDVALLCDSGALGGAEITAGFRERAGGSANVISIDPSMNLDEALARASSARAFGVVDDTLASAVYCACLRAGRRPGVDVAIAAVGDENGATWLRPALTVVDPVGEEIGRRAMDIILQRLGKTRHDTPQSTEIAPKLVIRESSKLA